MNIEEFERDYEKMPYSSIIKAFGPRPQAIIAIEEMSELTKELGFGPSGQGRGRRKTN